MRLTPAQVDLIKSAAHDVLGEGARVVLFGSRVNDAAKGGDVDLLVEFAEPLHEPAVVSARMATRISRGMHGRRVDVVLKAPNLQEQPIHRIALEQGVRL